MPVNKKKTVLPAAHFFWHFFIDIRRAWGYSQCNTEFYVMPQFIPATASSYAAGLSWYFFAYFTEACGRELR